MPSRTRMIRLLIFTLPWSFGPHLDYNQARNQFRTPEGVKRFVVGPKFLNYIQHIFSRGAKNFYLVTGLIKTNKISFLGMLRRELCFWPFEKMLYHGWISTMTSSNESSWKLSLPPGWDPSHFESRQALIKNKAWWQLRAVTRKIS